MFSRVAPIAVALLLCSGEGSFAGEGIDLEQGRQFWAFQRPVRPELPQVDEPEWARSPIDRFVRAKLAEDGEAPPPELERSKLVRRAYFDLHGLPPTPLQIEAFLEDDSPAAFESLVDQLLASPRFGERWGRHWLDVVRFAESTGGGRTMLLEHSWRYRDYVVGAFNRDKPYDEFVTEQLAGDLIASADPKARRERLIATSFLALGPSNYELQDKEQLTMEIVDEQVDTVGRAFLAMTFGCARCHDHLFDPISAHDYYALAGIFRSTKTVEHSNVSKWLVTDLPAVTPEEKQAVGVHAVYKKRLEATRAAIAAAEKELSKLADPNLSIGVLDDGVSENLGREERRRQLDEKIAALHQELEGLANSSPKSVRPETMTVRDEAEPADVPLSIRGDVHSPGQPVPRGFPEVIETDFRPTFSAASSGRLELARWLTAEDHPLTARVFVNRLWANLTGEGLVRTPDNFGSTGGRPTNPELLDWLALRLIENAWSTKQMLREMMLTRSYRSVRAEAQRLDAEALRDAMLLVSGRLDLSVGGPSIRPGTKSEFGYRFDSERRSLYLPVFRNALPDLFTVFDFPDPNLVAGKRNSSTLATQALYFMNHPFVIGQSGHAAEALLQDADGSVGARVDLAYRRALGRPPSASEIALAEAFLGDSPTLSDWSAFFQSLFACVDFRYVD